MLHNVYRKRNNYLRWQGITYQEYLQSDHWRDLRKRYFKSRLYKRRIGKGCYVCGALENLNVHHKTYKRMGNEMLCDIVALCSDCHNEVHEYQKEHPRKWLYGIAKTMRKKRHPKFLAKKKSKKEARRRKRERRGTK